VPLILTAGIFVRPQGLRIYKPARPPVPEDVADQAARRLAAEKEKEKKDVEKARARERTRAREALEKRRRRETRMSSRWSRRRRRLTTTTMMMMTTKTTTWQPDLASARTRGWARGR
jgi:hypothetical protein